MSIRIDNVDVYGFEAAIRGMRSPKNSWGKSDSWWSSPYENGTDKPLYIIGENDFKLMQTLAAAGQDHGKFLRMIHVQLDVTAPLYWWKEADQYKVGTVTDSCSTMHKIADKKFTLENFSCEHLMSFYNSNYWEEDSDNSCFIDPGKRDVVVPRSLFLNYIIPMLNTARGKYIEMSKKLKETDLTEDERKHTIEQKKLFWWQMIQLLPSSYNQRRTWDLNYAVLRNIYHARRNHKLDEWRELCEWIKTLPYSELITGKGGPAGD